MKYWQPFFLIGILFLLVACGSTSSSTTSASEKVALLVVRSPSTIGYNYPALTDAFANTTSIKQLYQMALALPDVPSGIMNCPADFGVEYQLTFLLIAPTPQQMTLDATGCQLLHISSDSRHPRVSSAAFRALLTSILHIPSLVPTLNH